MRLRKFWCYLNLVFVAMSFRVTAQDVTAIIETANTLFDNEDYFKAANFYLRALDNEPENFVANYKLAESYRLITNYHSAELYYEKALRRSEVRYPLARYYYALTQKYNGKYEEALNNFQTFIENLEANRYQRLRGNSVTIYAEQARIEREGCLLALKELSKPFQDHNFQLLSEPLNSVYNDYAPSTYRHDSIVVITSSRLQSQGSNFDNKFGESFTDIFRFTHTGDSWDQLESNDRFERLVNSNFHDGSGVFNNDFSRF